MNWRDYLEYNNGDLCWRTDRGSNKLKGLKAGSVDSNGYVLIKLNGKKHRAHRIVLEIYNGPIPCKMEIDHINHVKTDNRIENLRLVDHVTNGRNKSQYGNNKSGATGVSWDSNQNKWFAQITVKSKNIRLGYFLNFSDAVNARKLAEIQYGFHENHGLI